MSYGWLRLAANDNPKHARCSIAPGLIFRNAGSLLPFPCITLVRETDRETLGESLTSARKSLTRTDWTEIKPVIQKRWTLFRTGARSHNPPHNDDDTQTHSLTILFLFDETLYPSDLNDAKGDQPQWISRFYNWSYSRDAETEPGWHLPRLFFPFLPPFALRSVDI